MAAVKYRRMVERVELEQAAAKERNEVRVTDKFERHGLDAGALAGLQAQFKALDGVRKVYLVRKAVQHTPARPCFVLGYTVRGWYRKRKAAEVLGRIQQSVSFPGETLIISVEGENYRFGRKLRWMRGSRIL